MKIISKKELFPTKTLEFKTEDGKYILAEKSTFQRIFGRKDTLYRYIFACRVFEGKQEEVRAAYGGKIPNEIAAIQTDIKMANEKYGVRITEADIAALAKSGTVYEKSTGGIAESIAFNIILKNSNI